MTQIDFSPDNITPLFQQAVDEAIEQHRLNGIAIAQSDDNGNVVIVQPQDITPLADKLQQRKSEQLTQPPA
jgi:hypothetical protein